VFDPKFDVARHGACRRRGIGGNQTRSDHLFLSWYGLRANPTTLTHDGPSAVNTKLDHDSLAYKALSQKQSYTGAATIMGQAYEANYAPLVSADGKLTGALFVGIPK